ncbi:MAG: hypothetical protein FJ125_16015, partial [Deltaproteobacteria bacterium]|nr:hypothetical protein [Deltaproteobacteria bacterium]
MKRRHNAWRPRSRQPLRSLPPQTDARAERGGAGDESGHVPGTCEAPGTFKALPRAAVLALLLVVACWLAGRPLPAAAQTASPTTTATPVVSLVRLRQSYTIPAEVVAGNAFELYVVLENVSVYTLENVSVTFGLDPYGAGPEPVSSSNVTQAGSIRPGEQVRVYQRLRYAASVTGRQTLDLHFEYRYRADNHWITQAEGAVAAILVTPPTAT